MILEKTYIMLNMYFLRRISVRFFSSKPNVKLEDDLNNLLDQKLLKHRHHPGIINPRFVEVPNWIKDSIKIVLDDSNISNEYLWKGGQKLMQHLLGRHITIKQPVVPNEEKRIYDSMNPTKLYEIVDDTNINNDNTNNDFKLEYHEKEKSHHSSNIPLNYNRQSCLLYLVGRSQFEYSVVYRILNQIKTKDVDFKPKTLFDFGSGVGTVMWASSQLWSDSLIEYFGVDTSSHMNDLSAELNNHNTHPIKNVFYRQFFPATPVPLYDIVVSSFSLLELPDIEKRFDIVQKLWAKTQNYLVIIEDGTNAGFAAVNEARDILLYNPSQSDNKNDNNIHVCAPCPHDMKCPRYHTDNTPCNFDISYYTLPVSGTSCLKKNRFSYVVLKKGARSDSDKQWPRIVRPVLKRSRHVVCRTCTANGKLEEIIFTTFKYGKNAYRCARVSKWGDLLPIEISKDNAS
ncbi:PREDICTED: methyltransferase-like protein 17, mitochondrial [Polistes dominula]|uniref:Methyltransferase-like protein 17, mitochondrial n=1 Tax=Polistes dominula TaxID=743375 RepID=A0ABM1IK09_POLDO|nr:PREDICTED: methyltransferase-like protein 17, mitochondrial [Polistes dominula]